MKQQLLFISLLLIAGCFATDFITLDCNGDVSFSFQNWHNKISFAKFKKTYDAFHEMLYSRMKCNCPTITEEEFLRRFAISTWDFHFHKLTTFPNDDSSTCAEQFPEWDKNYHAYTVDDFTIKARNCSYENWKSGKPCLLKFPVSYLDLEYQLAVAKCPNSYFPYISVTCAGAGCKTLAMPCNSNSDCSANQICETLPARLDGIPFETETSKRSVEESQDELKNMGNKMSSIVTAALTASNNPLTYASNLASKLLNLVNPSKKRAVAQSNFTSDNNQFFQSFVSGQLYDQNDTSPGCLPGSQFLTDFLSFTRSNIYNNKTPYKFEDEPNLKFKICLFNISDTEKIYFGLEFNNNETDPMVFSLPTILDWDGKLSDGSDVRNADRMAGKSTLKFDTVPTITPTATTVFYHSCSNQFSVFPRGNNGIIPSLLYLASKPIFENTTDFVYNETTNEFDEVIETSPSFVAYSSIFAPILSQITAKMPFLNEVTNFWFQENFKMQTCRATARGKTLSVDEYKRRFGYSLAYALYMVTRLNPRAGNTVEMSDFLFELPQIISLPTTCTYENYLKTKACTLSFTGFQSLLEMDLTFNIKIAECADYSIPSIYVECVGVDCKLFTTPVPCSSPSDCNSFLGTKCVNIEDEYTEQSDVIQAYFTHNITSSAGQCSGKAKFVADIKKFMGAMTGNSVNSLSYCVYDGQSFLTDKPKVNMTEWAESQYIVDGDTFSIRDLKPWNPPATPNPNPNPNPTPIQNQQASVEVKLGIPQANQGNDLEEKIKQIVANSIGIDPKFLTVTLNSNGNEVDVQITINKVASDGSTLQGNPTNVAASVNEELANPNSGIATTLGNDLGAIVKSTTYSNGIQIVMSVVAVFIVCLGLLF